MLEVDGRRVSLKYAGKLGCFRVVAHDKVVMPAQSEMIIRGAVDDSANKLTYETDITISFVSSSLIRKLPRHKIFNLSPLTVKTS
jgi:hypothetical protein